MTKNKKKIIILSTISFILIIAIVATVVLIRNRKKEAEDKIAAYNKAHTIVSDTSSTYVASGVEGVKSAMWKQQENIDLGPKYKNHNDLGTNFESKVYASEYDDLWYFETTYKGQNGFPIETSDMVRNPSAYNNDNAVKSITKYVQSTTLYDYLKVDKKYWLTGSRWGTYREDDGYYIYRTILTYQDSNYPSGPWRYAYGYTIVPTDFRDDNVFGKDTFAYMVWGCDLSDDQRYEDVLIQKVKQEFHNLVKEKGISK